MRSNLKNNRLLSSVPSRILYPSSVVIDGGTGYTKDRTGSFLQQNPNVLNCINEDEILIVINRTELRRMMRSYGIRQIHNKLEDNLFGNY